MKEAKKLKDELEDANAKADKLKKNFEEEKEELLQR